MLRKTVLARNKKASWHRPENTPFVSQGVFRFVNVNLARRIMGVWMKGVSVFVFDWHRNAQASLEQHLPVCWCLARCDWPLLPSDHLWWVCCCHYCLEKGCEGSRKSSSLSSWLTSRCHCLCCQLFRKTYWEGFLLLEIVFQMSNTHYLFSSFLCCMVHFTSFGAKGT
jgi:hypothetical protein